MGKLDWLDNMLTDMTVEKDHMADTIYAADAGVDRHSYLSETQDDISGMRELEEASLAVRCSNYLNREEVRRAFVYQEVCVCVCVCVCRWVRVHAQEPHICLRRASTAMSFEHPVLEA